MWSHSFLGITPRSTRTRSASNITWASLSDCLMSYQNILWVGSYSSAKMQSVYPTALTDKALHISVVYQKIFVLMFFRFWFINVFFFCFCLFINLFFVFVYYFQENSIVCVCLVANVKFSACVCQKVFLLAWIYIYIYAILCQFMWACVWVLTFTFCVCVYPHKWPVGWDCRTHRLHLC